MSNTSSVPLTRHRTSGKKRFHSEATVLIKFSDVWRATVSNENLCTSAMSIRQQRHQAFLLFKLKVMTGIVRESLCIWERFIRRIAKDDISFSGSFNHRSKITTGFFALAKSRAHGVAIGRWCMTRHWQRGVTGDAVGRCGSGRERHR